MTTANNLIVVFLALEVLSIPLYVLRRLRPPPPELAGSRHQVLRARRVLLGDLPVRHRARVRRDRHHLAHRHRRRSCRRTPCSRRARWSPGSRCCSSASASRSRRCRSTRGRPTCTRARPRRSRASWRRRPRPPGSPRCCACSWSRSRSTSATGGRRSGSSPRSRSRSAASAPRCRPTSSACSRTRRSRTRDTCSWASRPRPPGAGEASLFYLFVYTFMVVGSFAVVAVISLKGDDDHSIEGYRGLAFRRPVLGSLLIFFFLAQAGIPLTGGFIAKLEVFSAAADARGVRVGRDRRGGHRGRVVRLPAGGARGRATRHRRRGSRRSRRGSPRADRASGRRLDRNRARGHRGA